MRRGSMYMLMVLLAGGTVAWGQVGAQQGFGIGIANGGSITGIGATFSGTANGAFNLQAPLPILQGQIAGVGAGGYAAAFGANAGFQQNAMVQGNRDAQVQSLFGPVGQGQDLNLLAGQTLGTAGPGGGVAGGIVGAGAAQGQVTFLPGVFAGQGSLVASFMGGQVISGPGSIATIQQTATATTVQTQIVTP